MVSWQWSVGSGQLAVVSWQWAMVGMAKSFHQLRGARETRATLFGRGADARPLYMGATTG